jgi:CBS domain-containing protein
MTGFGGETLSLFFHRVRDLVKRPAVTCPPDLSVVEVARRMLRADVGSIVVTAADGRPLGIVTDRDLRRKVVAERRDAGATTAATIMSSPVIAIQGGAFAFEAVLEMTRREIHHLLVVDVDRPAAVVSSHDFLLLQGTHPVTLAREIGRAPSLPALAVLGGDVTRLVRRLVDEGGTAYDIGQIVAELNDRMVVRALGLTATSLHEAGEPPPPVGYCWLALGSEARREQTLRTDQDNGLVYADPPPEVREQAEAYYRRFAVAAVASLTTAGFPHCPAGHMASTPRWCQPVATWVAYFRQWLDETTPERILDASIYFDLRPLAGDLELAAPLLDVIHGEAPKQRIFLAMLARDVASRRLPVTLLGNVAVKRSGPRRGTVDLKGAGMLQIVGAGRLHALELGLRAVNTVDRFRAAGAQGVYREEEVREITDAFQHLMRLRLLHQLERIEQGEAPDNDVDPRRLSHADRLLLREALRTVSRVQAGIRERFATDVMGGV